MKEILIISEELFKENGPIKEDTIITKFVPYINIAQKIYIDRIIGKPLMDELKAQIKASTKEDAPENTITPANQALILKIAPVLSFYAVYQGLPFHWASIVNKGLTKRNSENSDAVDVNDLAQLRRWIKDDAEELGRDLIEYLCSCKDTYPLWKPGRGCGCGADWNNGEGSVISPLDTGIFIPRRKRK